MLVARVEKADECGIGVGKWEGKNFYGVRKRREAAINGRSRVPVR